MNISRDRRLDAGIQPPTPQIYRSAVPPMPVVLVLNKLRRHMTDKLMNERDRWVKSGKWVERDRRERWVKSGVNQRAEKRKGIVGI